MTTTESNTNAHSQRMKPPDRCLNWNEKIQNTGPISRVARTGSFFRFVLMIVTFWAICVGIAAALITLNSSVAAQDLTQPKTISVIPSMPVFDDSLQDNITRETGTFTLDNFWRLHGTTR